MVLTAHQPLYLPWLGLFHKVAMSDAFCLFDATQYDDNDFQNRNRIKGPNGVMWLTVPVKAKDHHRLQITEIEIVEQDVWRRKHWKSLVWAYGKAPYFSRYADFFEETYRRSWRSLVELDIHLLTALFEILGLPKDFKRTSQLPCGGAKSEAILLMCRALNASVYVFGVKGREYADRAAFEAAGIGVAFQSYRHPVYPQQFGPFVPNLSVVDLLFNCGPNSLEILMTSNAKRATPEALNESRMSPDSRC